MRAYVAILLAAACFGTTGTARALGAHGSSALSVGAARIVIGGGLLALIAAGVWFSQRAVSSASAPSVGSSIGRVPTAVIVVIGAAGVVAYQPAFFLGTRLNGVAVGTIVALGSAPILTGLIDWALRRRFPGILWLVATVIATIGVTLLSGVTDARGSTISLPGLLNSLGAGASYAVYTVTSKAVLDRGWSPIGSMGAVFGLAAVFSAPLLLIGDTNWLAAPSGWAMALWLGVVTTVVAYLLFGWGLKRLPAATVSTLTLGEPLTATLLGILLLGEQLPPIAIAGLVVLAVGLAVLVVPWRGTRPADAAGSARVTVEARG